MLTFAFDMLMVMDVVLAVFVASLALRAVAESHVRIIQLCDAADMAAVERGFGHVRPAGAPLFGACRRIAASVSPGLIKARPSRKAVRVRAFLKISAPRAAFDAVDQRRQEEDQERDKRCKHEHLNGKAVQEEFHQKKRRAERFERMPTGLYDAVLLRTAADYAALLPPELEENFTSAQLAKTTIRVVVCGRDGSGTCPGS